MSKTEDIKMITKICVVLIFGCILIGSIQGNSDANEKPGNKLKIWNKLHENIIFYFAASSGQCHDESTKIAYTVGTHQLEGKCGQVRCDKNLRLAVTAECENPDFSKPYPECCRNPIKSDDATSNWIRD